MHQRYPNKRIEGFTLVELLVVIAIIGLLVALLLPAIQAAREAGRRASCSNNVKQATLSILNFESTTKVLPPGAITGTNVTAAHQKFRIPAGIDQGWAVFILPQLEQQAIYDQYFFDKDWRSPENKPVRESRLSLFNCPSTPNGSRIDSASSGGFSWQAAPGDYAPVVSVIPNPLFTMGLIDADTKANPDGALLTNQICKLSQITDGTSHTIFIAEDAGRPTKYHFGRKPAGTRYTGGGWADKDSGYSLHGSSGDGLTIDGPCAVNCTNNNEIYSFHPAGAQAGFADGSVRFLTQAMDIRMIGRLVTRAAGEPTSSP